MKEKCVFLKWFETDKTNVDMHAQQRIQIHKNIHKLALENTIVLILQPNKITAICLLQYFVSTRFYFTNGMRSF